MTERIISHTRSEQGDRGDRRLRRLDRWFGIPLIALLGVLHRPRKCPQDVGSIGFLLLGAIGDSLLASTVIAGLRLAYPNARIVCFVNDSNKPFAQFVAGADIIASLPIKSPLQSVAMIRSHQLDVLIDFGQWPRISAIFAALSGARFTIGFRTQGQARHFAFDAPIAHSDQRHEIDNFHALAIPLLGRPTSGKPHLAPPAGTGILPSSDRWVVFHPWPAGYRHEWRAWPIERWVALSRIVSEWGFRIAITGGPADRQASEALVASIPGALCLAGRASLADTIVALAECCAVVAVNTGVMHLAAALDKPLVGLHGPTNARRWGPLSDKSIALGAGPEKGCAYLNLGFEYPERPANCMECVSVADVAAALRQALRL